MKSKKILSTVTFLILVVFSQAQGVWTQKANFGGTGRFGAASFAISGKGYIGIGVDASFSNFFVDFWEYDPSTNIWTQKAVFPGANGGMGISFALGTKGYIGAGQDRSGSGWTNELWEYNSITNVWLQKADVPGNPNRAWTTSWSIGTKGYMCAGAKDVGTPTVHYDDLWEYDQSSNSWAQKANFGGGARTNLASFAIGTKAYVGTGMDNSTNPAIEIVTSDFWAWDQTNDTWSQKANFPGVPRGYATAFSVGANGYMGMGYDTAFTPYQDFYEYNPGTNNWSPKANPPLGFGTPFTIGTKAYLGTGYDINGISTALWQFTPNCNITLNVNSTNSACGMATGTATVVATGGDAPYTYQWTNGDLTASADSLSAGLYMVYVTDASGCKAQDAVMINDISSPTITVTSATDILCNGGNNGSINISVTGGTLPYTYLWGNGNTNQNMSNLQAGPHQVQVMDANGCKATKIVLLTEPAKITLADSIQNASCGSSDGAAAVIASGGTSPYTYAWSTGATTQVVTGLSAGSYSVLVTDANGCTKAGQGTIINVGSATATIDSIVPASCSSGTGSIYVSVNGGAPPYTYSWTNGSTTQDLVGVAPGMYGLTIYGSNPCTGAFSTSLPNEMPQAPVICIVSVDTGTGKNQCAFIKDSVANLKLKQYNFYRETTQSGVYQKLGSKAANLQNIWTDQSANPLQRAWRYKITAEDSCGNESPISVLHKTIHLVANLGISNNVNLIWDDYEGFSYNTFVIWRYTPATGWDSLDAVASSDHSYSDFNPPTFTNLFYFIEVIHPNGCSVQVKYPDPMASNLNSSRSNTYKLNQSGTSVQDDFFGADVQVYPNPSSGEFIIQGLQPSAQITVYNMLGKKVHESTAVKKQETISLNAPSGIYLLKVKSDKGELTRKVVIQSR